VTWSNGVGALGDWTVAALPTWVPTSGLLRIVLALPRLAMSAGIGPERATPKSVRVFFATSMRLPHGKAVRAGAQVPNPRGRAVRATVYVDVVGLVLLYRAIASDCDSIEPSVRLGTARRARQDPASLAQHLDSSKSWHSHMSVRLRTLHLVASGRFLCARRLPLGGSEVEGTRRPQ